MEHEIKYRIEYVNHSLYSGKENELMKELYEQRQEKVEKLKNVNNKHVSMCAGFLLQDIVEEELGIVSSELKLESGNQGKPYIVGSEGFHFNISHAGECVAIAYGHVNVGIDVELIRDKEYKIAKRCYTPEEYEYVAEDTAGYQERFFEIWTMKESYLKFTGEGISVPLNSFMVDVTTLSAFKKNEKDEWEKLPLKFEMIKKDNYIITICSEANLK